MVSDFSRIITLLRKEKGVTQKQAAEDLGVSQALLSHYEKGIRECGLEFVVRVADYYGVSCDYLLGRSPDRNGTTLTVEDIPEPDAVGKENVMHGSILPVLNKKLIANSMNILFDLLQKSKNKALIQEVSSFLMLAVYRVFRIVYSANPKNQNGLFTVPKQVASHYAAAAMAVSEANAAAVASGDALEGQEPLKEVESLAITSESLNQTYPMFASSLMNLIQNSESKITKEK
mgnify:FL=1